jgi:hypothetical protein
MEHPLIPSLDKLTEEELLDRIAELNKKLSIAWRMGNNDLCNQIRMAIESHQAKYNDKTRGGNDNNNFDEIINIS